MPDKRFIAVGLMVFLGLVTLLFWVRREPEPVPVPVFNPIPSHLAGYSPQAPSRNPQTEAGISLGQMLFFDPNLSRTGEKSCASCHFPQTAFASNARVDEGVFGPEKTGIRNTPTLLYSAWGKQFFWDGGAADLESQALGPLTDSAEMGAKLPELIAYLNSSETYRSGFKEAFGVTEIKTPYVLRALAQFQRSLYSFTSKWDKVQDGKAAFSTDELDGQSVFQAKCASCHTPPLFTDGRYHNKGLHATIDSISNLGKGSGRYRITHRLSDYGAFKTPTLRNVARTFPYGHDGSIESFKEMLDRMDGNLHQSPWIDSAFRDAKGKPGFRLSDHEKNSLLAFMNCLTD